MKFLILSLLSLSAFCFDHSSFDEVLKKNVVFKGKQSYVNYSAIKKSPAALVNYIKSLEKLSKKQFDKMSEKERLAFLINVYNANTIKLIIDHYPVKSIKKIGSIFSSPWKLDVVKLFGKKFSLDNIEHDMIRKDFEEPRIHFAVNCASFGCPSLRSNAFTAENLEQMLEASAKNFLTNPTKNKVVGNKLMLSKIFKWYGQDFKKLGGAKAYVMKQLGLKSDLEVDYLDYGWSLNDLK